MTKALPPSQLRRIQHRLGHTREYKSYYDMVRRCYRPKSTNYAIYGGRGIVVCPRWMEKPNGFLNFMEDMGSMPSDDHTLDRIDNDKNYGPDNCQWETRKQQTRNRGMTLRLENGEALGTLAERSGIGYATLFSRFKKGERGERLMRKPQDTGHRPQSPRYR